MQFWRCSILKCLRFVTQGLLQTENFQSKPRNVNDQEEKHVVALSINRWNQQTSPDNLIISGNISFRSKTFWEKNMLDFPQGHQ